MSGEYAKENTAECKTNPEQFWTERLPSAIKGLRPRLEGLATYLQSAGASNL